MSTGGPQRVDQVVDTGLLNAARWRLADLAGAALHRAADTFEDVADRAECWARPRPPGLHTCQCSHPRWLHSHRAGQCLLCACTWFRATWLNIDGRYRPITRAGGAAR